jgi:serine/threonine-protein kinase 24/25/MST4
LELIVLAWGGLVFDKLGQRNDSVKYAAPEVIQGSLTTKADIWSLGVTALHMALLEHPLKDLTGLAGVLLLSRSNLPLQVGNASPDFRYFLSQCLEKICQQRPRARDLLQVMIMITEIELIE